MPPETDKKKTSKDKMRSLVSKQVAVLDKEKIGDDLYPIHTIAKEAVRKTFKADPETGTILISFIDPDPNQVRKVNTNSEEFEGLAASISEHGVLEPITVRWVENKERYQIITGERRYRAALRVGLDRIPAIIRDIDDTQKAIHQLVENLQRQDLNPIEEARAYQRYLAATGYTQRDLAKSIGKSEHYVSHIMSLLEKLTRAEQEEIVKLAPAQVPGKSLILEAVRTDDKEMRLMILRGQYTREQARQLVKHTKPKGIEGRPKKFIRRFDKLAKSEATVSVSFPKPRATDDEILTALQSAVNKQKKIMKA